MGRMDKRPMGADLMRDFLVVVVVGLPLFHNLLVSVTFAKMFMRIQRVVVLEK